MRSVLCQHFATVLYQYCAGLLLISVEWLGYTYGNLELWPLSGALQKAAGDVKDVYQSQ